MCNKKRFEKYPDEPLWKSDLAITTENTIIRRFTICPKCRKIYTLSDIFGELIDKTSSKIVKEFIVDSDKKIINRGFFQKKW